MILGSDGKQYGPVPADKVQAWIRDGRANLQTQAQRQGETEWKTLGDFSEFSTPVPSPAATPGTAPASEPAPAPAPTALPAGSVKIDVFGCLDRSFHLWTANFLPLVGVTLLVYLLQGLSGAIPIVGPISSLFLRGVFYGGLCYYYLGKMRGERREVGDAFAGFNRAFVPLMLTTLLYSAIILACLLLFFFPWIGFFIELLKHPNTMGELPEVSAGLIAWSGVGMFFFLYVSICLAFPFVLVIDKGLAPWEAVSTGWRLVTSQWFRVFFVSFLGGILTLLGLLGLLVGVLFTLPLALGAVLYAYETLFNPTDSTPRNP